MRKIVSLILVFSCFFSALAAQSVNFTSSNLPIVVITTNGQEIPDEPKLDATMGIINNGTGNRNNITDPFNDYDGKIGIEIHGHSSQMFPMKSYGIELRDASDDSQDKPLLGMPKESDWILYAPYTDKTLMRNVLAYQISREMGRWAARCQYVELVVDGDYRGVYVLMEKIKRNANRVNIAKMATTDTLGDGVTGGFIFSLDKDPDAWFSSFPAIQGTNNTYPEFTYVYPKIENIVPAQQAYVKSYVDSFESTLASANFQDPVNGVRKFADIPSFIDYFIINELSRNVDGYRLSSYFYKDRDSRGGKIVAGPVWDYDLAFRNADYCDGSDFTGWGYRFNDVCPADGAGLVPFWWNRFMIDTAFEASLRCRWKELRQTTLNQLHVFSIIDSIGTLLSEAEQRHFQRWPILGQYVWPNPQPIPTSYAGELTTLKGWINDRLGWIDGGVPDIGYCYDAPPGQVASFIVSLNPNPLFGDGNLIIQSKKEVALNLRIFDGVGRLMQSERVPVSIGTTSILIHTNYWARGVYFVSLRSSDGYSELKKLVRD